MFQNIKRTFAQVRILPKFHDNSLTPAEISLIEEKELVTVSMAATASAKRNFVINFPMLQRLISENFVKILLLILEL